MRTTAEESSSPSLPLLLWEKSATLWRVLLQAALRFFNDNCFIRANAIAYSIVISIIPLLTVLIKYAAVDQAMIRLNLSRFLAAYGVSDNSPLFSILDEILMRSNAIAGIGSIFMIYAATNMLRHLEDSFNYIYRAESERPILYRFAMYIASLVVLPGLIILFSSAMRYYVDRITPPRYHSISSLTDGDVITGNQGYITIQRGNKKSKINLQTRVVTDAPFKSITIDTRTMPGMVSRWEWLGESSRVSTENRRLESRDYLAITGSSSQGDEIHLITETGVHFFSTDGGQIWDYDIFSFKSELTTRSPILEDIELLKNGDVFILGTTGSSSILIHKHGDQWRWKALESVYHRIVALDSLDSDGKELYITGNGRIQKSLDLGMTWSGPIEVTFGNRSFRINDLSHLPGGGLAFAGDGGSIWLKRNGKYTFPDLRARYDQQIRGITIEQDGTGFLYGANRLFRFTVDGGKTWHSPSSNRLTEVSLYSHTFMDDGSILFVGDEEMMVRINGISLSRERDRAGYHLMNYRVVSQERYPAAKSMILRVLLLTVLFTIVFSIFFFMYILLPNARVDFWAASIGSGLTSMTLLSFVMGFRIWVDAFASTRYIYGVWAIIPVGMLVILISNQIILFGLEVAYIIQHPRLYRKRSGKGQNPDDSLYSNSLVLLVLTYRHLYRKNRPLSDRELRNYFHQDMETVRRIREKLVKNHFLSYNSATGEYFPLRPPGEIYVREIQSRLFHPLISPSPVTVPSAFRKYLSELEGTMRGELDRIPQDKTLRDLISMYDDGAAAAFMDHTHPRVSKKKMKFPTTEEILHTVTGRKKRTPKKEKPPVEPNNSDEG